MPLHKSFSAFAELLLSNQGLTAIDRFYHPNIEQYENHQEPLKGKKLLRAKEEAVSQGVSDVATKLSDVVIVEQEQLVWGRMTITFKSEEVGAKTLDQAFMQRWKDGQIIEQRFYYAGVIDQE